MFSPEMIALCSILILILVIAAYLLLERYLRHQEKEWQMRLREDNNKAFAPLRISAYERIIVMLERITPASLVLRHTSSSAGSAMLQLELIRSIREEFEHNVSLQMYVSEQTWAKVKLAKEEVTEMVKTAFTRVKPEAPAMELSREIFKLEAATGNPAVRSAIAAIRGELRIYF